MGPRDAQDPISTSKMSTAVPIESFAFACIPLSLLIVLNDDCVCHIGKPMQIFLKLLPISVMGCPVTCNHPKFQVQTGAPWVPPKENLHFWMALVLPAWGWIASQKKQFGGVKERKAAKFLAILTDKCHCVP